MSDFDMAVCAICGKLMDIVLKTSGDDWWVETYHLKCVQEKEAWIINHIYNLDDYKKEGAFDGK